MNNDILTRLVSAFAEHLDNHGEIKTLLNGREYIIRGQYGIDWLKLNDISLSCDCARFFEAEITNEGYGGIKPSTLASALDSLRQGDEVVFDNINYNDVLAEVNGLIAQVGGDVHLEYLIEPYAFALDGDQIWVGSEEAKERFNIIIPMDEELQVRKKDLAYEKNKTDKKAKATFMRKLGKG